MNTAIDNLFKENLEQLKSIERYFYSSYNFTLTQLIRDLEDHRLIVPKYQRGLVWNKEQKELLIDSILRKLPIGSVFVNRDPVLRFTDELIDGQQRLVAIRDFLDNKFSYKNIYYRDAKDYFDDRFSLVIIPTYMVNLKTKQDAIELYRRINYGGTPHSVEELIKLEKLEE